MKFTPKSEKEIAEASLWPAGEYAFEIVNAVEKQSKSGNDMIELIINVFNSEGSFKIVKDYLLESMAFKLRHAADGCGILDKYDAGEITANDFIGKVGYLKLKIDKNKDPQYADKNAVQDYVVKNINDAADQRPIHSKPVTAEVHDDSIPF